MNLQYDTTGEDAAFNTILSATDSFLVICLKFNWYNCTPLSSCFGLVFADCYIYIA